MSVDIISTTSSPVYIPPLRNGNGRGQFSKAKNKSILNDRQERFVAEYLVDLNATKAAIRAGYSSDYKSAGVIATRLLADVRITNAIERSYSQIYSSLGVKAQRALAEIVRLALSDTRELFDDAGNLRNIKDLPDSIAPAISSVEVVRRPSANKDDPDEYVHKIRLWDKTKALNMLGKHLGLLKDTLEINGQLNVTGSPVPLDQLPVWHKMITISILEGKQISKELETKIIDELGIDLGNDSGVKLLEGEISNSSDDVNTQQDIDIDTTDYKLHDLENTKVGESLNESFDSYVDADGWITTTLTIKRRMIQPEAISVP